MVAERRHCFFIKNWHDGFKALWDGRTSVDGFHALPLMRDIGLATGMEDWFSADVVVRMSDYVSQMLIGDRTRNLLDLETGWNGREFFNNRVFAVEGIRNGILGALETNQDGRRQVELLTTRLDEPDRQKRDAAEAFVVKVLSESHMYKVYHNSTGGLPALGDLIKLPEFRDADHRPGTFGEMLRYGSVHWEQTRAVERLIPEDTGEELIRAGVTKPANHVSS
jgi:hypothetical protein